MAKQRFGTVKAQAGTILADVKADLASFVDKVEALYDASKPEVKGAVLAFEDGLHRLERLAESHGAPEPQDDPGTPGGDLNKPVPAELPEDAEEKPENPAESVQVRPGRTKADK